MRIKNGNNWVFNFYTNRIADSVIQNATNKVRLTSTANRGIVYVIIQFKEVIICGYSYYLVCY